VLRRWSCQRITVAAATPNRRAAARQLIPSSTAASARDRRSIDNGLPKAIDRLFARFDAALTDRGYLAMGGQIIDATVVSAPKQRNTEEEKTAIKDGRIPERWQDKPAKVRQKDRDARWSIKYSKAKVKDGADPKAFKPVDLAIPMFGYKNHIGIDRAQRLFGKSPEGLVSMMGV